MENLEFEKLLAQCKGSVERYVYYKLPTKSDGDDVIQEVYLTAFQRFSTLKKKNQFKSWIITIAKNKCRDFYRNKYNKPEIEIDEGVIDYLSYNRYGIADFNDVHETIEKLSYNEGEVMRLYYLHGFKQLEIAKKLKIPVGTVKSRLYAARKNFKNIYPYPPTMKGVSFMNKLPNILPKYRITELKEKPFTTRWEELLGWFIVPRIGEKISWAIYDYPERNKAQCFNIKVTGKSVVHGIVGVEIESREYNCHSKPETSNDDITRTFVSQLTDTHCRILSESHYVNGIKHNYTFLDGDDFLKNWGFGEDNCGKEINLKQKELIVADGEKISTNNLPEVMDVVGRFEVDILGKKYDTIRVMDIESYNQGVMSETYIDKKGRTILWRRFNKNDWKQERYKQL